MEEKVRGSVLNRGNTCFLTSALQILFRYLPFQGLIKDLCSIEPFSILESLYTEFSTSDDPINPDKLIDYLKLDAKKQFDVCEFVQMFITILYEKAPEESKDRIFRLFFSQMRNTQEIVKDTPIIHIIPAEQNMTICTAIRKAFSDSKLHFIQAPRLLFVQISRMQFSSSKPWKDIAPMLVDFDLSLASFWARTYHLYAITQHIGSGMGGHYRTFLRSGDDWIYSSDSNTRISQKNEILSTSSDPKSPAYLLAFTDSEKDVSSLIRRQISSNISLLFKVFEPKTMSTLYTEEKQFSNIKEVEGQIEGLRMKAFLEFGDFKTKIILKNGVEVRSMEQIPPTAQNIIMLAVPPNYRFFNPVQMTAERIVVRVSILRSSHWTTAVFHPQQTSKDVFDFSKAFVLMCNLAGDFSIFIKDKGNLQELDPSSGVTLFEMSALFESIEFIVSISEKPVELKRISIEVERVVNSELLIIDEKIPLSLGMTGFDILKRLNFPHGSIFLETDGRRMDQIELSTLAVNMTGMSGTLRAVERRITRYDRVFSFVEKGDESLPTGEIFHFAVDPDTSFEQLGSRIASYIRSSDRLRISFFSNGKVLNLKCPYEAIKCQLEGKFLVSASV